MVSGTVVATVKDAILPPLPKEQPERAKAYVLAAPPPDAYTRTGSAGGAGMLKELEAVYGNDPTVLDSQSSRYASALKAFCALYGPGPASVFRAPGRVNLIGEHTDYSQGYVLPVALDRDVLLVARRRADSRMCGWPTWNLPLSPPTLI